jgi:hypothetical protein
VNKCINEEMLRREKGKISRFFIRERQAAEKRKEIAKLDRQE